MVVDNVKRRHTEERYFYLFTNKKISWNYTAVDVDRDLHRYILRYTCSFKDTMVRFNA